MQFVLVVALIVAAVYWFTGGKFDTDRIFGPPENLPLSRYNDLDVNVYFYFPSGNEKFLGRVHGASACGDTARSYAAQHNLSSNSRWGYVCCTVEAGSSCYRKIR